MYVAVAVLVTSTNFVKSSSLGKICSCTLPLIFISSARGWQTRTLINGRRDAGAHWRDVSGDWVYKWTHFQERMFLCQDFFCSLSHGEWESRNIVSRGDQSWVTSSAPLGSACPCSCSQVLLRRTQAQAGFNVLCFHPAGSGQQPKARGQRAGSGPQPQGQWNTRKPHSTSDEGSK